MFSLNGATQCGSPLARTDDLATGPGEVATRNQVKLGHYQPETNETARIPEATMIGSHCHATRGVIARPALASIQSRVGKSARSPSQSRLRKTAP